MYCETLGARRPAKVAMAALSVEARTTSVKTQLRLGCNRNDVDEGGRAEHGAVKWAGREPVGAQEWGGLEISEASTALAGLFLRPCSCTSHGYGSWQLIGWQPSCRPW